MAANCTVRDGRFVEPCEALESIFAHSRLYLNNLINVKSGERTRSFVVIKSGTHQKKGLALNFCPCCGARIDAPFTDTASGSQSGGGENG